MIHLPSRTLRTAVAVLLSLAATSALAEEGVLVGEVPPGLGTPALVQATQRALVQSKWSVLGTDAASVDAKRKDGGNDCALTIYVSDGILKYRGTAKVAKAWGVGKDTKMIPTDGSIPGDWLDDLRSDIRQSLIAAIPRGNAATDTRATVPAVTPSTETRTTVPADKAAANTGAAAPGANANPADTTPANPTTANTTTADKLKELEQLRKDGLVSEPEYQQMRKAILAKFTE